MSIFLPNSICFSVTWLFSAAHSDRHYLHCYCLLRLIRMSCDQMAPLHTATWKSSNAYCFLARLARHDFGGTIIVPLVHLRLILLGASPLSARVPWPTKKDLLASNDRSIKLSSIHVPTFQRGNWVIDAKTGLLKALSQTGIAMGGFSAMRLGWLPV
jgi:hypothetical protein